MENDKRRMNDTCVVLRLRSISNCRDQPRKCTANASALTGFVTRGSLVDNVNASLATNHAVVTVTSLQGLERILDLHGTDRSVFAQPGQRKTRLTARHQSGGAIDEEHCRCQPRSSAESG